ncbi:cell wall-binding repeat-containing protein [Dehalobacter sp. DCM]|uniref:cell wall-binding repeat-containing protein n=1 Tax=Dehalobacter sp. DCM TaxID=2907827 RepID=UPI0030812031|nr:cell wall-binding repeat-containing protein [Dehalobacter sp. DCM]
MTTSTIKLKSLLVSLCLLMYTFVAPLASEAAVSLSAPANVTASVLSPTEIILTWNTVTGADTYSIYRATSYSGSYSAVVSTSSLYYKDTGLTPSQTYYYKIIASNTSDSSNYSSAVYATTFAGFTNVSAVSASLGQIYLSWYAVSDASSYAIYRSSTYSGNYTEIGTTAYSNFTDSGLSSGSTYYYKIYTVGGASSGVSSSIVYATAGSSTVSGPTPTRLSGGDRYDTSALISQHGWTSSTYAVVTSGENYPDALCSSPLAAKYNAPILLTNRNYLNSKTRSELSRLRVSYVFLIGGTSAITTGVEQEIRNMGISVSRIAGVNRYDTSAKIALNLGGYNQAVIATGENFPDALSIAPIAAKKAIPILLVSRYDLPDAIKSALNSTYSTYVIGDTTVIGTNVFSQLPSAKRLSGTNRYETNLKVVKEFSGELNFSSTYVATGQTFPDALAGSALAAKTQSPILLVGSQLSTSTASYLSDNKSKISKIVTLGSTGAVSASVQNAIMSSFISAPSSPANLTAKAISTNQIALSWPSSSGASSYAVYRSTSYNGAYTQIATAASTAYVNSGLSANTTYYYRVKAVNSTGASIYSSTASAKTTITVPNAPTNLKAVPVSSSQITLFWSPSSNTTSYLIYRATSSTGSYTLVASETLTTYTNSSLSANTPYYYKIQAVNSAGYSSYSTVASATTLAATPSAPSNLTATASSTVSTQIGLSWSAVSGATSYSVYRATSINGTYNLVTTTTATAYTDTGLTANTTYYYKLKATNSAGSSGYSNTASATTIASTKPNAPTDLTASAISTTQIQLDWTASTGAATYTVYRSDSLNGTYTAITTVAATTYTNTGLTPTTKYYYKLIATNTAGSSGYSAAADATTLTTNTAPTAPTNLEASASSATQISLSWSAATGASTYTVYRSSSEPGSYTAVTTLSGTVYTDSSLTPSTTYYYKVLATNAFGNGPFTNPVSATTLPSAPAAPTDLQATADSSSQISLTWTPVAGATSYTIYRSSSSEGTYTPIAPPVPAGPYADTGLTANTTYYYKVSANNAGGSSNLSATANATTAP